jgi:hypothetical protein
MIAAVGPVAWMSSWQRWQTTRVFRRHLIMIVVHVGLSDLLGLGFRSGELVNERIISSRTARLDLPNSSRQRRNLSDIALHLGCRDRVGSTERPVDPPAAAAGASRSSPPPASLGRVGEDLHVHPTSIQIAPHIGHHRPLNEPHVGASAAVSPWVRLGSVSA